VPPVRESPEPDPELDELWERLASLSDDQRRCVVLRFYEDLTVPQIAEVLVMPEGSVKSHLHRAVGLLRDLVREEEQ
jgi:RNA polymerase sigma-70 factor (ECF subfamily)